MLIGISGKSGAGKSELAANLAANLNANVINFDKISHLSIEKESFKNLVREKISEDVFDTKGNIMRKKLGEIVFNDKEKLNLINSHSEKIMIEIIDELIKTNTKQHLILEYALLPLMKYFNMCDIKILVKANEAIRCERIMNRDGIGEEYFKSREKHSIDYIPSLFDIVVENNSNESLSVDNIISHIKNKENLC